MNGNVTTTLGKMKVMDEKTADLMITAFVGALSGADILPRLVEEHGVDAIPVLKQHLSIMTRAIHEAMIDLGMPEEEIKTRTARRFEEMAEFARAKGIETVDDAIGHTDEEE